MKATYSTTVTRVVIDDRERAFEVQDALTRHSGVEVTVRRLRLGDYEVDDRLLVERKTIADFALSVIDTRLFRQAWAQTRRVDRRSCLIAEGTTGTESAHGLTIEAYRGALLTISLVFGLPLIRTETPRETAWVIVTAAAQLARRRCAPPRRPGCRPHGLHRAQLLLLEGLPGIGAVRAATLLRVFGSPEGVARASKAQLETLVGFGKATAGRVWSVLHEVEQAGSREQTPADHHRRSSARTRARVCG